MDYCESCARLGLELIRKPQSDQSRAETGDQLNSLPRFIG